ncbi:hypothetical protein Y032_1347g3839 [Ancylostoma ceylanicum]|uniref:Uncharacterized protein n=1 Tax=Ancylostoma ceylanicum TaxID=53326 RepID=A0A016W762_9BILA|nr:hypothetical protein Y032_1347g3839 [Ancylostoma ceylanicum]
MRASNVSEHARWSRHDCLLGYCSEQPWPCISFLVYEDKASPPPSDGPPLPRQKVMHLFEMVIGGIRVRRRPQNYDGITPASRWLYRLIPSETFAHPYCIYSILLIWITQLNLTMDISSISARSN